MLILCSKNFIFCVVLRTLHKHIYSFHSSFFLYSLKLSENFWFSAIFPGYRMRAVACNGLTTNSTLNRNKSIEELKDL